MKGERELQDATSCNTSAETPVQMGFTEAITVDSLIRHTPLGVSSSKVCPLREYALSELLKQITK